MIYRREREIQERHTFHRKQQLKDALASGKNLPTELRKDAVKLGKDLQFDEAQVGEFKRLFAHVRSGNTEYYPFFALSLNISICIEPSSLIDSEYAKAGILDPKIIITTSRDPSSRLLQFAKVRQSHHLDDSDFYYPKFF